MKILIACEYSGTVRDAFRRKGHDAWSCDILPTEGAPEFNQYHIKGDALDAAYFLEWDLMIAHPPCTYLSLAGANRMYVGLRKENGLVAERVNLMKEAAQFFKDLMNAPIERIAIENPLINGMAGLPKHDQIIQPYYFGHEVQKRTCLWLKNLPKLKPTKVVDKGSLYITKNGKSRGSEWFMRMPIKDRAKNRSKTFQGIADAMADQWGSL